MALLKGLKLTLRSMGPKWVAKEITRRVVGKPYTYNGSPGKHGNWTHYRRHQDKN